MVKSLLHFDLTKELEDYDTIHEEIQKDIVFKGTKLWILAFAIVIASIGLNTNSTAVVIGAMLISPLMGPINGMGYTIATYNFRLFRMSLRNFGFAVIAGLLTSTIYFAISPVSTAQSELLARTSPTIYDVLIALFGGLAGIVAISSKLKGNVIPGVAIATALMPPLCTAGYGLATGQFSYFFGAFYLFTINSVFIGISSVVISQVFKFPMRTIVDPSRKKRINQYISLVILITLVPSIYFGYQLVQEEKFNKNVEKFVKSVTVYEGAYLLRNETSPSAKTIKLVYGGNELSASDKQQIKGRSGDFGLLDAKLFIDQGFSINDNLAQKDEADLLKSQVNALTFSLSQSEQKTDSILKLQLTGRQLLREIKPLYPQILSCSYAETLNFSETDSLMKTKKLAIVAFGTAPGQIPEAEKEKLKKWLASRLRTSNLKIYYEEE